MAALRDVDFRQEGERMDARDEQMMTGRMAFGSSTLDLLALMMGEDPRLPKYREGFDKFCKMAAKDELEGFIEERMDGGEQLGSILAEHFPGVYRYMMDVEHKKIVPRKSGRGIDKAARGVKRKLKAGIDGRFFQHG